MRLKVRKHSTVTADFEVMPGFVVTVRQLGTDQREQFGRMVRKPGKLNPKTREMVEEFDHAAWCKHGPALYLADWRGLTVEHVRRMVSAGLEEDPETVDGCIPFDLEFAEGLFEAAMVPEQFVPQIPNVAPGAVNFGVIVQFYSSQVESTLVALEELRKNSLDGSSTISSASTSRQSATNARH